MYNMSEVWRPAAGCVGIDVSNFGRVRNSRGRILGGSVTEKGYRRVTVQTDDGKWRHKRVHRLVLETFVGPCPPGMETRHLNGVPDDNRLANLSWGTSRQNSQDMLLHGRHPKANKTHCPRNHPLVGANLAPWALQRGWRECLACNRARASRHGWTVDSPEFKELADEHFEALGIETEEEKAA